MKRKKPNWFQLALQLKGSVIPAIYQRVICVAVFGFLISVLYYFTYPVSQPIFGTIIPSIVLGLLLVFRTNTAYERFWEGRRLWGNLANDTRNMAWQIWVMMNDVEPEDRAKRIALLRLVAAFPVACKLYLRSEPVNRELEALMSPSQYLQLKTTHNPPLAIVSLIGDYLQQQYQRGNAVLHYSHVVFLQSTLKSMMESLGSCERILKTPLPLAYAIHLRQLLLIYCLLLPFQLVKDLGWGTGAFIALISFTLFGIEEIGCEIENPFGYDANDLPLDSICAAIKSEIEDSITWNCSNQGYTDEIHQQNLGESVNSWNSKTNGEENLNFNNKFWSEGKRP
jgi:putative membrane protein